MDREPTAEFGLLEDDARDSWGTVADLDVFFTHMYKYFYHKGLPSVILTAVCNLITLAFTMGFSTFLLAFVDWGALRSCNDEQSCRSLDSYIISNPFSRPTFLQAITLVYLMLSIVFLAWKCVQFFQEIKESAEMAKFYHDRLGITLRDLRTIRWNDVVTKFIQLQESGTYRVAIKDTLTAHDIVSRVMRRENYMIAFINKGLLDLRVPWWISQLLSPGTGKHEQLFLSASMEWSINFCLLQHMLDDRFRVSHRFLRDVQGLQNRFILAGVVHFICLPFLLIFMIFHFFLQNAQQFHSDKSYLGPRQWSPLALWMFREFNELPHVFEERINRSYKPANEYQSLFHQPVVAILARCTQYIAGSFVAVLLMVTVFNDSVLLYVSAGGYNLIWYTGIFSAIYAVGKSLAPNDKEVKDSPEHVMQQIISHIHYYPDHWKGKAHTLEVRDEFSELFQYKARLFMMEVLSVIITPLVLCFSLPRSAQTILDFVKNHTAYVDGVGDVCAYATFDFEKYGDDEFGAPISGRASAMERPQYGKMEKSFVSFKHQHPDWESDQAGRAMMTRLSAFRGYQRASRDNLVASLLRPFATAHEGGPQLPPDMRPARSDEMEGVSPMAGQVPATMVESVMPPGHATTQHPQRPHSQQQHPQLPADSAMFAAGLPSILRSALKEQDIDYENDFYWLEKFRDARRRNQEEFEKSLSDSIAQGGVAPAAGAPSGGFPDLSWLRGSHGAASSIFAAFQPGSVNTSAVNYPPAGFPTAAHSNVNTFAQMQAHQRAPRPFGRPGAGYTQPRPAAGPRPGAFGVQLPQEGAAADSTTGYIPPTTSSDLEVDDV